MNTPTKDHVIRYVITYINRDGVRQLLGPAYGHRTHEKREQAVDSLKTVLSINSESDLAGAYGPQAVGTFEVRPCECWPRHFDPKTIFFDD